MPGMPEVSTARFFPTSSSTKNTKDLARRTRKDVKKGTDVCFHTEVECNLRGVQTTSRSPCMQINVQQSPNAVPMTDYSSFANKYDGGKRA